MLTKIYTARNAQVAASLLTFASLANNEMDFNLSNKSPSIAKGMSASNKSSNDPKLTNEPNKRDQRTTVIVGDSLLKGIFVNIQSRKPAKLIH